MTKTSKPSLAETHPELAAQAHGWAPDLVWAGSYKKMSWKCTSGHIWEASISNRSRNGTGCPVCLNRKVLIGLNDLATTHPELAKEADGWDPTSVTAGSHEKVSWKCHLEHTWVAQVKSRSKVGSGCPVCSNRKVHLGFNDLATTHPELAKEADGWDPTSVTAGSHEKVSWKCQLGHTWMTEIVVRKSGFKCPFCSNYKVHLGFNDLATTHPELAKEADGWDPTSVIAGSKQKVSWKCQLGHTWMATLNNRTSSESACPICSNKKVVIGFNDLATTNPELALEADGWDPKLVTFGSGKKLNWKCNLGHQWKAMVASRSLGMGCPICSHKKLLGGFNDLATTHPELAKEADGWDPTSVTAGSHEKVSWKCQLGHTWMAQLHSRSGSETGCPICSHKKLLGGFNDLATTHPELAKEADGWDPTSVIAGSKQKVSWKCQLGHTWMAQLNSRRQGRGCPSCSQTGFDPGKPGFLYLIDNFDLHMFQIGITNFPQNRLSRHKKSGWQILELRGPMKGRLTQQLETDCLHALEKRGAVLGHKAGIEKFDGYSEAWTKASLNVSSIKQILDWVYEDESK
jgi:hypothetical protein